MKEKRCRKELNNAVLPDSDSIRVFLTNVSPCFHEHLGFKKIGHFTQYGYNFGLWYDMIWMEKMIGEHVAAHDTKSIHAQ